MANVKEPFSTLDNGSGVGVTLRQVQAGDSSAAKNGLIGFSFKDASGNVVLPSLDAGGNIPVAFMSNGKKSAKGQLAAGSVGSLVDVTGASLTLALSKVYTNLSVVVASRSDSLFQVVHVDDSAGTPVETVVAECLVGAGQYSFMLNMPEFKLDTTADTGIPLLKIKAENFELANCLYASLSVAEMI